MGRGSVQVEVVPVARVAVVAAGGARPGTGLPERCGGVALGKVHRGHSQLWRQKDANEQEEEMADICIFATLRIGGEDGRDSVWQKKESLNAVRRSSMGWKVSWAPLDTKPE